MTKTINTLIILTINLLFYNSLFANTEDELIYNYVSIKAGIIQPTSLYGNTGLKAGKSTYSAGFSIGRQFHELLSVDAEYMYRDKNTMKDSTPGETDYATSWAIQSDTFLLNLNLSLMNNSRIKPFIRGGAGIAINNSDTYTTYDSDSLASYRYPGKETSNFAWQVGTGVSFDTNAILSSEILYSYINRGTVETQSYYLDNNDQINYMQPIYGSFADHLITFAIKLKF